MKIGERLIAKGAIGREDLERALEVQRQAGGRLGSILVRMGAVSEDAVLRSLSEQLGYPCVEPAHMPAPLDIYKCLLPLPVRLEWWLDNDALLWEVDGQLQLVAKDPLETQLQDLIAYLFAGRPVQYWLARTQDIDTLVDQVRRESAVTDLFSNSEHSLQALIEEAPVVELVNNLLAQAVDSGASDIHVEPEELRFTVRMRVDGVLHTHMVQPAERYPAIGSRIKLIAGLDIAEKRLPQDGRITLRLSGQDMDIRVSTAPGVHGESIVMRLLPKNRGTLSLEKLGFEPDHLSLLHSWLACPNGIVLVTGPTGSGKSTTLYAALEAMRDGSNKIITVEDPVEYRLSRVNQVQVNPKIGLTFSNVLRSTLRQDPDILLVGEMRDNETVEIGLRGAITGHLVLTTLHTNDAVTSALRLIDMGAPGYLVASALRAVVAQRLVRRVCEHCACETAPDEGQATWLSVLSGEAPGQHRYRKGRGCQSCNFTGYAGRIGVYELLELDQPMMDALRRNDAEGFARAAREHEHYRPLALTALDYAREGITSVDEVLRLAEDLG